MRSDGVDQAEGLRRLLVLNQTQVITVVAGKAGVGRTSATINLAVALARSGKDVLVLDENHGPNNLLDRMGLSAKHDLLDVAQGKCGLCDAVLAAKGFGVLPTARAMHALAKLDQPVQQRLENALTEASDGADIILVDAAMSVPGQPEELAGKPVAVSPSLASGGALLVVVEATPSGITESYALIKRLALKDARQQFGIAVNKAGNVQAALTVFENMAKVARRNLSVRLEYLGHIPSDERLRCAMQLGKSVVEAFPSAASAKSYLELSQKLLCLPMQRDEAEGGVSAIIQSLIRQVSRPAVATS
ncbi:MinD/ParA family ATP-binding protein [Candidatus Ferrigenium straubiae]|uniref:MinD/ParA family ATP-binding protein n=1 Tax=Candidatus Ferrigenium straubiae TaxID=2919506 RepID=UPI003F4AA847